MQFLKYKITLLFKKPIEKRPDQKNITNFHSKQQLDFRQKARATISHTACAVCRIFVHVRKMRWRKLKMVTVEYIDAFWWVLFQAWCMDFCTPRLQYHLIETVENSFPICFKIKSKQKSLCKLYISMLPRFDANLSVFRIDENSWVFVSKE